MAQITWEAMNPIDTSRYLDSIQKAQAQSVAGVEQIGNAYKGYQDNLKKQNTNDMLTALNQAQNPEQLAAAQANIAAMQQRWGSGYDMDAVRTAMDTRPAELMQRQSAEMDFNDKQANRAARPEASAIRMSQLKSLGATPDQLARIEAMDQSGADSAAIAENLGQFLTNDRSFKLGEEWKQKDYNQKEDHYTRTLNQNADQFGQTNDRANRESAWGMGKDAQSADLASGAGTTYIAADGTEYTTGGGGGAAIANYASKFSPSSGVRGIRNNNPGNIEFSNQPGASIENKGSRFASFSTPEQGINAMSKQLDLYYTGKSRNVTKPINTIQDIVTTWAPPKNKKGQVENNTAAYIATVAKSMGVSPTAKLNLTDPKIKTALMSAMITHENGGNPYTREQYIAGIAGNTASSTPANAPLVGIDRKVQQKIRGEYQDAMLKYNENLALKDQPVNVGNVLAGLTAKEKGSTRNQDAFDIVNALKDNEQLKGLSAEGITNVYNRAKSWQAKPGTPIIGYNSADGLKASINNYIKDEIGIDAKRKEHVAKSSHPSNMYAQKIQQEFEAKGVSLSAKEALLHIDPARYQSLYGKPTVKIQEAVDKKVDKVAATAKPEAKASPPPTAASSKPAPQASSQAFIPYANLGASPVTTMTPKASSSPAKPKPQAATPKASTPKAETKAAKPTKQDVVAFYVKRGEVGNVVPNGINSKTDRQLIREAQAEATKQLAAKEVKQKADAAVKRAAAKAEAARFSKEYEARRKPTQKAKTPSQSKSMDVDQLRKAYANQQALSLSNAARKAKEEEERKRKNK